MKRAALSVLIATAATAAMAQPQFVPFPQPYPQLYPQPYSQPMPLPQPQLLPAPQSFVDRARVQSVEPQYENVAVPRQECSSQWINEARPVGGGPNLGGVLIGGVAGGILGNQVGKGSGRDAATAAGAVIGAIAGDRIASNTQPQYVENAQREVRSCRTVNDMQSRLTGYRVNYTYAGHQYSTFTREQPGSSLPVRVSVTPAEER